MRTRREAHGRAVCRIFGAMLQFAVGRGLLCQIAWNCDPTFASNSDPPERIDLST